MFSTVFHHYSLATVATPGRGEGHGLWFRGWPSRTAVDRESHRYCVWWGIWHYTQVQGCGGRCVDGAAMATPEGDTAESSSRTAWVHPYHHCVVTHNSTIPGKQHNRRCCVQCFGCRLNRQSNVPRLLSVLSPKLQVRSCVGMLLLMIPCV